MATVYLINPVQITAGLVLPGTLFDTVKDASNFAAVQANGGVFWPSTDTIVAAAAAVVASMRLRGQVQPKLLESVMEAAVQKSQGTFGLKIVSGSIDFSAFAALANGVKTLTVKLGNTVAIPSNARFQGISFSNFTGFDDPAHGTYSVVAGSDVSAVNEFVTTLNVATGQSGFPKSGTLGTIAHFGALIGGLTGNFAMKITGSADLNTATVGHVDCDVFYFLV